MLEFNKDNFAEQVEQSALPVVVDFWGPQCAPCLALMLDVEKLAGQFQGKAVFGKVNVAENRRLCISLKVMSIPTILFYKGGSCVDKLTGADVSIEAIQTKTAGFLG